MLPIRRALGQLGKGQQVAASEARCSLSRLRAGAKGDASRTSHRAADECLSELLSQPVGGEAEAAFPTEKGINVVLCWFTDTEMSPPSQTAASAARSRLIGDSPSSSSSSSTRPLSKVCSSYLMVHPLDLLSDTHGLKIFTAVERHSAPIVS